MEARLRAVLTFGLSRLIGLITAGLVGLTVLQVVLRHGFNAPLFWVEEVSVMALIWLTWLGVTYLWMTRSHIAVDVVRPLLPAAGLHMLNLCVELLALTFGAALVAVSLITLADFSGIELGVSEIDAAVKYVPVTIGGIGLSLAAALNIWRGRTDQETAP